jgi:regulation of enolase protein 1 (concanavalin A-like superfamily)
MLFEALENFEWYNDPENVRFDNEAMVIYAKQGTDFWQSTQHGISKDNGHFFFSRQKGDFTLSFKWKVDTSERFSQCGMMLRRDEQNWVKAALMNEVNGDNVVMSAMAINGHADCVSFTLSQEVSEIWFKLQRHLDDYMLMYSLDGVKYIPIRTFYLKSYEDIKVGAYMANPSDKDFNASLSCVDLISGAAENS